MLSHQDFQSWQQSPIQGAIPAPSPFTPADESYLQEVLMECRVRLESALATAKGYSGLPDLAVALSDAITGCQEALVVVNDPKTYQEQAMNQNNETSNSSKKNKTQKLLQEPYKPDAAELKKWREAGYPGLKKPSSFA
jgi:hypothetical protein